MIPPGKAGEKRRANADDCSMAFGGLTSGNAPIKKAARTPSSKPKIILSALGRMITPTPLSTPAAARVGWERHCQHPDSDRINVVNVAQMQSP